MSGSLARFVCCLAVLALIGGCGCDLSPLFPGADKGIGEDLATAKPLQLDADNNASFTGTISGTTKAHVFDIGACAAGDRITVVVNPTAGSGLDPTTAIFNAAGEVLALNDDADVSTGQLGSYVDEIIWEAGDHFYLAISRYYGNSTGGEYQASVHVARGGSLPQLPVQVLLLGFSGGTVNIPGEGSITFAPFDAADIDAAYAGQTNAIKAKIKETVVQNYRNTGVQVVTSDEAAPAPGTYSAIYFGAYSATKFGVADGVDQGNKNRCDDGIVFTDDFDKPFANRPTVDGIGIAIGNVAAHEAGHLLGLNHVGDVTDLMDTTGTASTLLADQEFKTSSLHQSVFPFGVQNGPNLLSHVVPK